MPQYSPERPKRHKTPPRHWTFQHDYNLHHRDSHKEAATLDCDAGDVETLELDHTSCRGQKCPQDTEIVNGNTDTDIGCTKKTSHMEEGHSGTPRASMAAVGPQWTEGDANNFHDSAKSRLANTTIRYNQACHPSMERQLQHSNGTMR